jgi:hypothetical protein
LIFDFQTYLNSTRQDESNDVYFVYMFEYICAFHIFTLFLCKSHRIIHFYQHKSAFSSSAMSVTYAFNYRFEKLRFEALKILNENGHLSNFLEISIYRNLLRIDFWTIYNFTSLSQSKRDFCTFSDSTLHFKSTELKSNCGSNTKKVIRN